MYKQVLTASSNSCFIKFSTTLVLCDTEPTIIKIDYNG